MVRQWFENWFDSPYYYVLYEDRDGREAELFLNQLLALLRLPAGARVLDVACGRGRHALYLNRQGFDVEAYDLSANSIAHNRSFENDTLKFTIHDMRKVFRNSAFDAVFVLFSSFGYFDNDEENIQVMQSHAAALKPGGRLIMDYLNPSQLAGCLRAREEKVAGGIRFYIQKEIRNGFVWKTIAFHDGDEEHEYREKIRLYSLDDFRKMFALCHLEMKYVFGNYALDPYDPVRSERTILIAEKK